MSPAFRLSAGSGGLEWPQVLALLAREARTPMGRELATATLPFTDPGAIRRALAETRQAPGRDGPDRRAALGGHPGRAAHARARARARARWPRARSWPR